MRARAAQEAGRPAAPPPPAIEMLTGMVAYLPLTGILVLSFDAGPWWLGVGLIVAGPLIGGRLARERRDGREPTRA